MRFSHNNETVNWEKNGPMRVAGADHDTHTHTHFCVWSGLGSFKAKPHECFFSESSLMHVQHGTAALSNMTGFQ